MSISGGPANRSRAIHRAAILAFAVSAFPSFVIAQDTGTAFWTGNAGTSKWEDAGNWSLASGSTQSVPPADSPALSVRSGNVNNLAATIKFDSATMQAYLNGGTLASGAALHVGTLIVGEGTSGTATLNFSGGTLSVGSFFVGGWPLNDEAVGTLIMSGGVIQATGTFTVGNENSSAASHGTILMSGGEIDYGSNTISFGNCALTGAVLMSGGLFNGTGLVTIGGSTITSGSTSTTPGVGSLNLSGTAQFLAGSIELNTGRPNAALFSLKDILSIAGGTLSVGSLGQGVGSSGLVCSVSFTGGTVTANTIRMFLNQQAGTLSPGDGGAINGGTSIGSINLLDDSPGKQAGHASYTQAAGAHLLLDLASASSNDVVHLENNGNSVLAATLNGEIDLNVKYNPTANTTFNVLTADSISDNSTLKVVTDANYIFSKPMPLTNQPIPTNLTSGSAAGSILQLTFVGHARNGDATRDQTINSADFAALAAHFGQTSNVGWAEGDFNGDGKVNALDFNALASNYGKSGTIENPTGGDVPEDTAPLGSVVPEPISATTFLAAAGFSLLRRKHRKMNSKRAIS